MAFFITNLLILITVASLSLSASAELTFFTPPSQTIEDLYQKAVLENKVYLPKYIKERRLVCESSSATSSSCLQSLIKKSESILNCEGSVERWQEMALIDKNDMNDTLKSHPETELPEFVNTLFLEVTLAAEKWMREHSNKFPDYIMSRTFVWTLRAFTPKSVNAIASTGGDVLISDIFWKKDSLFNKNDIRAVLAHEVAHVLLNHSLQMGCLAHEWNQGSGTLTESLGIFSEDLFGMYPLGKSRLELSKKNETSADEYAAYILKSLQRPASDMTTALTKLSLTISAKGISSGTHPEFQERIDNSKKY